MIADINQYLVAKGDHISEVGHTNKEFNLINCLQGATPICCIVAECVDQVVGVCVLRQEEAIQYIRAHYNIEDFVYFNCHRPEQHGHLYHLLLSPIFSSHCKHFIKVTIPLAAGYDHYYHYY